MEPVEVTSKFPGKPGMYRGSSVGSGNSLTTRDSYLTHCDSVFDEFVLKFTLGASPTAINPPTTYPSAYANAVTGNLPQSYASPSLQQEVHQLAALLEKLVQCMDKIETKENRSISSVDATQLCSIIKAIEANGSRIASTVAAQIQAVTDLASQIELFFRAGTTGNTATPEHTCKKNKPSSGHGHP
jgi:hypothetical protein